MSSDPGMECQRRKDDAMAHGPFSLQDSLIAYSPDKGPRLFRGRRPSSAMLRSPAFWGLSTSPTTSPYMRTIGNAIPTAMKFFVCWRDVFSLPSIAMVRPKRPSSAEGRLSSCRGRAGIACGFSRPVGCSSLRHVQAPRFVRTPRRAPPTSRRAHSSRPPRAETR